MHGEKLKFIERYLENPPSGSQVVPCGRTDGQTNKTMLVVAFCNVAIDA